MHYYQHHIGDFIKDTSFLTNEEIGVYLKLIWLYYDTESPLPNDIFALSMKTGTRDSQQMLNGLLGMFFVLDQDQNVWFHNRCENEIKHYKQQLNTASKAGKASAAKRAINRNPTTVEQPLNERATEAQPTNNQEPLTNNHNKATVVATPEGVSDNLWKEFKALRKLKKAPITDRVIDNIKSEADKAGWTLEKALAECVTRGWQAFKAEWVAAKPNLADVARMTVPGSKERDPTLIKIENDRKLATPPPPEILAKIQALKGRTYG